MANINEVNEENFEQEVLKVSNPVLVDFSTPWCGPCRKLTPLLEQIQNEYSSSVKVVKVDADKNLEIVKEYGISSFPSILIFKDGDVKETMVGLMPKSAIVSNIKKYI